MGAPFLLVFCKHCSQPVVAGSYAKHHQQCARDATLQTGDRLRGGLT